MEDFSKIDENSTIEVRVIKTVINSYGVRKIISDRVECLYPISSNGVTLTLSGE